MGRGSIADEIPFVACEKGCGWAHDHEYIILTLDTVACSCRLESSMIKPCFEEATTVGAVRDSKSCSRDHCNGSIQPFGELYSGPNMVKSAGKSSKSTGGSRLCSVEKGMRSI